jgi:hypothetical protein
VLFLYPPVVLSTVGRCVVQKIETKSPWEMNVFSKALVRVLVVGSAALAVSTVVARPAWAALKYGSYQLSQLAGSSKLFECEALLAFGVGFISLAILVRKWQSSEE